MQLGNHDLGGVNSDGDGGTVGSLAVQALDVDNVLLSVDLDDLAFTANVVVVAANNLNFVVLADWQ